MLHHLKYSILRLRRRRVVMNIKPTTCIYRDPTSSSEHRARRFSSQQKMDPQTSAVPNALAVCTSIAILCISYIYKQLHELHDALDKMIPKVIEKNKPDYIFIKADVPEHVREKEQTLQNQSFLGKPQQHRTSWKNMHGHDIWAIIKLTKSDSGKVRRFVVNALATLRNWPWSDAEYCMIAQALDSRTIIALAHTAHADPRFFLQPPSLPPSSQTLEQDLRDLICALPKLGLDECAQYFVQKALGKRKRQQRAMEIHEDVVWKVNESQFGGVFLEEHPAEHTSSHTYMLFLQALLGHSKLQSHCPAIVKNKGLKVLRKVYEKEKDHSQILHIVGKILSNLSFHDELHEDIVKAGWVTIFAEWMRGSDLELKLHAIKALTNMDKDHESPGKFQDGVYLYHPQHRTSEHAYVDIVFVHGVRGGPVFTWRQRDDCRPPTEQSNGKQNTKPNSKQGSTRASIHTAPRVKQPLESPNPTDNSSDLPSEYSKCWPQDWLPKDCPNVRILTIEFDTYLSDQALVCPYDKNKQTLIARSTEFVDKLQQAGVGQRPVIWVGHSMGGLIIKKMLLLAEENPGIQNLVNKTKGIVFFSVPHKGSHIASKAAIFYPSIEVKELVKNSPPLLTLHRQFKDLVSRRKVPLLSFGEGLPYNSLLGLTVQPESSDPGMGLHRMMEDMNHLTICKPASRDSPIYKAVVDFILHCEPHLAIDKILKVDLLDENIFLNETN